MSKATTGMLHHVELWVPDLPRAVAGWSWLLDELGYVPFQSWSDGRSWRLGPTYLVFEQSPALSADKHDRRRPGLNHLAFHVESRAMVDALAEQAPRHGWTLLFPSVTPTPVVNTTTPPIWRTSTGSRSSSSPPRRRMKATAPTEERAGMSPSGRCARLRVTIRTSASSPPDLALGRLTARALSGRQPFTKGDCSIEAST